MLKMYIQATGDTKHMNDTLVTFCILVTDKSEN